MRHAVVLFLLFFAPFVRALDAAETSECSGKTGALVVSLQGSLQYDRNSINQWQPIALNQTLCEGSQIRVGNLSRASILLPNGFVARIDENTLLTFNTLKPDEAPLLKLWMGFVHFISRTPKHLRIDTPIANAGPEGTEFALSVNGETASLWVYEGGVKFFNKQGSLSLKPGESAQAYLGKAPQARIDIKPKDAVNWALYYPPLIPPPDTASDSDTELKAAITAFRQSHSTEAISRLNAFPPAKQTPYFHKVRGAMLLAIGRVGLAQQDIEAIRNRNPNDAEALALQSVTALTQNRKDEAQALANRAITANPKSATAFSALSYAEQGRFNLNNALKAANEATRLAPGDAMIWARKAELELALGLTSDSEDTVQQAEKLDAGLERTQTVIGFNRLQKMEAKEAMKAFDKALQLDSTSPLARLGLGLAKIRNGNLAEGRQDLEIAATLDPNSSIVRSYLGKAYYEERRADMAEEQFKLAKERDPKDPTSYFYDAINKQTTNRPVEALHDMQKAVELNNNRAVYRSSLLLDKDSAARTANLARIYNDLGFGRVALRQAWNALNYDSINPTAHRFLSDAYIGQPRFQAARASELLQAQLLQPTNITPVQPQLTAENIGILNSTGPGSISVNEYDPLYNSNGAHIVLNGAYGSNNTKTDNAIISGIYNKLSGSLGQFHYQTDGFRQNDSYQQDIYNAFVQYAITPSLSFQGELKSDDIRNGDVPFRINGLPKNNFKQTIERDTARVGAHLKIDSNNDVIASYIYSTFKDLTHDELPSNGFFIPVSDISSTGSSNLIEMQHLYNSEYMSVTTGAGYINQDEYLTQQETDKIPFSDIVKIQPPKTSPQKTEFSNGYVYLKKNILHDVKSILGLSYDSFDNLLFVKHQFNPKLGFIWTPHSDLTIRSAAFRTLKKPRASNQTIEPTQIAGFNQFFDEFDGTSTWEYALGIDYKIKNKFFMGGEASWRRAREPLGTSIEAPPILQKRNTENYLAYFYWIPNDWFSIKSEYHLDVNRRQTHNNVITENPSVLNTHQVPISVIFFHPSGILAKLSSTYVSQFIKDGTEKNAGHHSHEDFWTFDVSAGFRFPKKIGVISFDINNLFNNHFKYQSAFDASGPQLTPYIPERQFFVRLSLFY